MDDAAPRMYATTEAMSATGKLSPERDFVAETFFKAQEILEEGDVRDVRFLDMNCEIEWFDH
jgi:hypothetical protein